MRYCRSPGVWNGWDADSVLYNEDVIDHLVKPVCDQDAAAEYNKLYRKGELYGYIWAYSNVRNGNTVLKEAPVELHLLHLLHLLFDLMGGEEAMAEIIRKHTAAKIMLVPSRAKWHPVHGIVPVSHSNEEVPDRNDMSEKLYVKLHPKTRQ